MVDDALEQKPWTHCRERLWENVIGKWVWNSRLRRTECQGETEVKGPELRELEPWGPSPAFTWGSGASLQPRQSGHGLSIHQSLHAAQTRTRSRGCWGERGASMLWGGEPLLSADLASGLSSPKASLPFGGFLSPGFLRTLICKVSQAWRYRHCGSQTIIPSPVEHARIVEITTFKSHQAYVGSFNLRNKQDFDHRIESILHEARKMSQCGQICLGSPCGKSCWEDL